MIEGRKCIHGQKEKTPASRVQLESNSLCENTKNKADSDRALRC